jgi:hypothetical protein
LSGDIDRLKGSLETLAIQSGGGVSGGLRVLVKSLDATVGRFAAMPPAVSGTMTILAGLGGASLLALAAFVKIRKGLAEAVTQLNAMGPAGEKAAVGLQKTAGAAGKAAIGFAAMEAGAAVLDSFGRDAANVDRLADSLLNFANTGNISGEMAEKFGRNLKGLNDDAAIATNGTMKWLDQVSGSLPYVGDLAHSVLKLGATLAGKDDYQTANQNLTNLDQALASAMATTNDATKATAMWNEVVNKSGLEGEQLIKMLPNAWKEVGQLNQAQMDGAKAGKAQGAGAKAAADGVNQVAGATPPATDATKKYTTAAQAAAGAAKGQRIALGQLSDFMKAETDPVFGLIKAEGELKSAQDKATKAIKEHGRNSKEAKAATQDFALAAIGLQGAVGNVSGSFNGKLSPALVNTLKKAGASKAEIKNLEQQFKDAKKAADKYSGNYVAKASAPGATNAKKQLNDAYTAANHFAGPYRASVSVTGDATAMIKLRALNIEQNALRKGVSISTSAARALAGDAKAAKDRGVFSAGGWTGPGGTHDEAGVVHADEFVLNKKARGRLEDASPGGLDYMNRTGKWPGYDGGGRVWPFQATAAMTRIPSKAEAMAAVIPAMPGGAGGPGYKWMERVVRAAFPGMPIYSDYRPGAITLTGNKSYHGFGRAVDFAPSKPLAQWINAHYMRATKELITPWQSLNIHNGSRHAYSALVENQHNFAGGNAHDHWAMKNGGVISEPIFGVGASGRTYSFGENYQPERVSPMWQNAGSGGSGATVNVTFNGPVGNQLQLETWMSATIDNLRRKGKI